MEASLIMPSYDQTPDPLISPIAVVGIGWAFFQSKSALPGYHRQYESHDSMFPDQKTAILRGFAGFQKTRFWQR